MALGITINNEPLDIAPGTKLELEQENPFIQFNEGIKGDFTLPFDLRATPDNLRLLDFPNLMQKKVNRNGIDCAIFDNGWQHSIGKLQIERPETNRNNLNHSRISCYYQSGVASFFQDIKELRMTEIDLGGNRTFVGGGNYALTGSHFWGHINEIANAAVNAADYAFYPVINKAWQNSYGDQAAIMNHLVYSGGNMQFNQKNPGLFDANVIVPFPYLHYVLKKLATHIGWQIQGAILNDTDFRKITMVNFYAVDWAKPVGPAWIILGGNIPMRDNVTINLQNHMPSMTVAEFLVALKNRFGWWYDFDRKNKIITINGLQQVISSTVKDFSRQASVVIQKKVPTEKKVYSLKNEFYGEYANGSPSMSAINLQGSLNLKSSLPAAGVGNVGHVYLIRSENNYYVCRPGTAVNTYAWELYAYNVYDVTPDGATDEITTKATTLGSDYDATYQALVPRMDMNGVWIDRNDGSAEWGIHLLMYYGKQPNTVGTQYPFAGSGIYSTTGTQMAAWSLAFKCEDFAGNQVGLYDLAWKKILESIATPETFDISLELTKAEFLDLRFSDTIIIDGVKMYFQKVKSTVPFIQDRNAGTGILIVEALRIS
jgi:hypothetical protein